MSDEAQEDDGSDVFACDPQVLAAEQQYRQQAECRNQKAQCDESQRADFGKRLFHDGEVRPPDERVNSMPDQPSRRTGLCVNWRCGRSTQAHTTPHAVDTLSWATRVIVTPARVTAAPTISQKVQALVLEEPTDNHRGRLAPVRE